MSKEEKKSILYKDYTDGKESYTDGEVEDYIYKIFQGKDSQEKIFEILGGYPSWPLEYHLSKTRENILNWYTFNSQCSLLEVGAGCGAVTGLFCEKLKEVYAVELTKKRAEIVANRHIKRKNLKVIAGDLNLMDINKDFDYVTLIGVLEYAGAFTKEKDPFLTFLKKVKTFLKEKGCLIIAIENKFGLKYWSGAREDHSGIFFDSIENYPKDKKVMTFSKKEIRLLLERVGFKNIDFYYPFPDYKMPHEIFSDNYFPSSNHFIKNDYFPTRDYLGGREIIFNEKLAMDNIIQNGDFSFFANSFLIFAK